MTNPSTLQNVSRETFSRLESYVRLLQKWNPAINLIGKSTEQQIWDRHIADCLQLLPLLPPHVKMADMGSGAGLPGLVIAIARPDITIDLIEQDQRKSAFLQEVIAHLGLKNSHLHNSGIKQITKQYQLITARALAPLRDLCTLAYPLLETGAICLFPKGKNFAIELEDCQQDWGFAYQLTPSATQVDSTIVSISELQKKA